MKVFSNFESKNPFKKKIFVTRSKSDTTKDTTKNTKKETKKEWLNKQQNDLMDLCNRLQHDAIETLSLGLLYSDIRIEVYEMKTQAQKRSIQSFFEALANNKSITRISIGPRLPTCYIHKVLEAIVTIPTIQHVFINAHDWIPETMITNLLSAPNQLDSLELNNTRIEKSSWSMTKTIKKKQRNKFKFMIVSHNDNDDCDFSDFMSMPNVQFPQQQNLTQVLQPYLHKLTKKLAIRNCGWKDHEIMQFCNHFQQQEKNVSLRELSLEAMARQCLSPATVSVLCSCTNIYRLEINDYQLSQPSLKTLCTSLQSNSSIQELSLAKNYFMPTTILTELVEIFINRKELDLSHCNLNRQSMTVLFETLVTYNSTCQLERLIVQSAYQVPTHMLQILLEQNTSLTHIILSDSLSYNTNRIGQCNNETVSSWEHVICGLQKNKTLRRLELDWPTKNNYNDDDNNIVHVDHYQTLVKFYLELNEIGRNELLQSQYDNSIPSPSCNKEGWLEIMIKYSNNPTCLYWLLQEACGCNMMHM